MRGTGAMCESCAALIRRLSLRLRVLKCEFDHLPTSLMVALVDRDRRSPCSRPCGTCRARSSGGRCRPAFRARGCTRSAGLSTMAARLRWLAQPRFQYGLLCAYCGSSVGPRSSGHRPHGPALAASVDSSRAASPSRSGLVGRDGAQSDRAAAGRRRRPGSREPRARFPRPHARSACRPARR